MFLRTEQDRADYGCPEPKLDTGFGGLPDLMGPIKMMGAFIQDKSMQGIIDIIGVFVQSSTQLIAVFQNQYEGDDFCSGLIFGSNGA